jgi:hypothetical protein
MNAGRSSDRITSIGTAACTGVRAGHRAARRDPFDDAVEAEAT